MACGRPTSLQIQRGTMRRENIDCVADRGRRGAMWQISGRPWRQPTELAITNEHRADGRTLMIRRYYATAQRVNPHPPTCPIRQPGRAPKPCRPDYAAIAIPAATCTLTWRLRRLISTTGRSLSSSTISPSISCDLSSWGRHSPPALPLRVETDQKITRKQRQYILCAARMFHPVCASSGNRR
jgi:hypothetical protein